MSNSAAVLFLVIGCGVPLVFYFLAGSKDPVRRARVRWQVMLLGSALGLISAVLNLAGGQVFSSCAFGFMAIALAVGAVREMRSQSSGRRDPDGEKKEVAERAPT